MTYGTQKEGMRRSIGNPDHHPIQFYVDANHGGCPDSGRSTTGVIMVQLGDCVYHKVRKQGKVCNSTCAAELYAVAEAARMASYVRNLYFEITNTACPMIYIWTDSQVVCKLLKRGNLKDRTKHLHLAFHEIKEMIDKGEIKLMHIPGKENPADLLTKPLPRVTHEKHTKTVLRDDYDEWRYSKKRKQRVKS